MLLDGSAQEHFCALLQIEFVTHWFMRCAMLPLGSLMASKEGATEENGEPGEIVYMCTVTEFLLFDHQGLFV